MHYEELEPLPALAPFIERVWTLEGHAVHAWRATRSWCCLMAARS